MAHNKNENEKTRAESQMAEAQLDQDLLNLLLQGGYAAGRSVI